MYTFAMTRIESSSKWNSKKYVLPKIWHWKEKFRRNKIEFCGDPREGFGSSSDAWWYWYFFISKSFKNIQPFNSSVCSLSYSCETLIEPGASSELRSQGFVVRLLISGACLHSLMECVLCFTKLPCSPLEHPCVLYVCTFALLNYCAWGKKKDFMVSKRDSLYAHGSLSPKKWESDSKGTAVGFPPGGIQKFRRESPVKQVEPPLGPP